jgi:hypothetical protein
MARLEFFGSLYLNDKGEPVIPGELITACLVNGAKAEKKGKDFKASVFSNGLFPLQYSGPKKIEDLWEDKAFVDQHLVRIQASRILRTRPIFQEWKLDIKIDYLDNIQENEILKALEVCGQRIGLGDWRPTYGRFTVEKIK